MTSKKPGHPAKPRRAGDLYELTFEQLLTEFVRDIDWYASGYPKSWQKDFCQVGKIALFEAYQKFIVLPPERDFRPYALTAISNRMVDFYRKTIERAPVLEEKIFTDEDGDEVEYIYNVTGEIDFFTTTTFDMDYQVMFNKSNLLAHGFSESEIQALNLHLLQDIPVGEVASQLGLSPGRISQILSSLKQKSQVLLTHYYKT